MKQNGKFGKAMKNILVTGHLGYIGPHLIQLLKQENYLVTGCDLGFFEESFIDQPVKPDVEWIKDFRAITVDELSVFDTVMHLAAISNDPMGEVDSQLTYDINLNGTIELAEKAKKAGVQRFLLSSSCSIYGKGGSMDLDESAELNPLTAYAKSKIESEKAISALADDQFCPVFLRNSTAYGYSPSFRIDLVVNNFLSCAYSVKEIQIKSDGEPWRPLIHCKDIARAFVALGKADRSTIFNKAINIGGNQENYQVKDVAKLTEQLVPDATIVFTGEIGNDPRNYRVNFNLLNELLPDFKLEYSLASGMNDLLEQLKKIQFSESDFYGDRFIRLKLLQAFLKKHSI